MVLEMTVLGHRESQNHTKFYMFYKLVAIILLFCSQCLSTPHPCKACNTSHSLAYPMPQTSTIWRQNKGTNFLSQLIRFTEGKAQ